MSGILREDAQFVAGQVVRRCTEWPVVGIGIEPGRPETVFGKVLGHETGVEGQHMILVD